MREAGGTKRRQQEVVETAARIFVEKSFHASTMQDIAEAVGILKGSLYYYFAAKEALLEEIVAVANDHGRPCLVAAGASDDPVREFVAAYLRWAAREPYLAALLLEAQPTVAGATGDRLARIRCAYRDFLVDAIAAGDAVVDAQVAAEALLGFLTTASRTVALGGGSAAGLESLATMAVAA
jgi:AcrR family transcriptional regulator